MAVHEPPGLVLFQQVVEAVKPLVGLVEAVVQAACRGMGQQQVDAARAVGLEPELPHPAAHLPLGVLVGILVPVVADAAAQPHDAQPFPDVDLIVHADAAARLAVAVAAVMVAVHIQDRGRGKIRQIFQVFLGQVAAGKDQVDPLQPLPCAVIPQCFGGGIRNRKYLHVRNAPFC